MSTSSTILTVNPVLIVRAQDLPYDMRRLLRVQFKEFINFVEDAQLSAAVPQAFEQNAVTQGRFKPAASSAAA